MDLNTTLRKLRAENQELRRRLAKKHQEAMDTLDIMSERQGKKKLQQALKEVER